MKQFDPLLIGGRVAGTIMGSAGKYASYTTDLGLEGLLYLYDASKDRKYLDHVLEVWKFRESKKADGLNLDILFTCLHFETYLRTGDKKFIADFLQKAEELHAMLPRDQEGAVCNLRQPEKRQISVDMLQAYAVFMARAGWLSGESEFYNTCTNQYQLFRNILRNHETGLWHRGRNWTGTPGELSPGYWNRGQGWVLRGIVNSLEYLPKDSVYFSMMIEVLKEFTGDLLKYQDVRGMWHQLADHPESYPETSGTAMFVHYLYKAFHRGWLSRDPFMNAAENAIKSLLGFVREDGTILNTSLGASPQSSIESYLYKPAVPGDPHSAGYMLMACAGPYLARSPVSMV